MSTVMLPAMPTEFPETQPNVSLPEQTPVSQEMTAGSIGLQLPVPQTESELPPVPGADNMIQPLQPSPAAEEEPKQIILFSSLTPTKKEEAPKKQESKDYWKSIDKLLAATDPRNIPSPSVFM